MQHDDAWSGPFARGIIRRKALALIGRAGLTADDRPDLEQELALRLLQAAANFEPERGHPRAFITTVVERAVAGILRQRLAKKRSPVAVSASTSWPDDDGPTFDPADETVSDPDVTDLAMDVAEVLRELPEQLRELAEQLQRASRAQVARDRGVPPTTLQRRIEKLRSCFVDAGLRIYL